MTIPLEVSEKEQLGRRIFSTRRKITYRLFYDNRAKEKLSVDRIDLPSSISVLIEICNKTVKDRGASGFYGWAVMTAKEASIDGRKVLSSPLDDNPYHANIVLPDSAINDQDERKDHAKKLADKATLHKCG